MRPLPVAPSAGNERTPHTVSVSVVSDPMLRIALGVSLALHLALGVWVEVRGAARDVTTTVVDSWTGPGIEIDSVTTDSRAAAASETSGAAVATPLAPLANPGVATAPATPDTHGPAVDAAPRPAPPAAKRALDGANRESRRTVAPASPEAHSHDAASVAASAASTDGSNAAASGAFGAAGLPAGVRHLPKAFTRALGLASRGDPRWLTQPAGAVGEIRIRLDIDEEGRLGELEYLADDERSRLAPVVAHLLENTRLLLLAGRFSLAATRTQAGTQTLRVRVEITERSADVDPDADPNGLNELEYEAPNGRKPGRGSFRLNSGRRVIGWVYVE
jgi:hypothetical protein